MDKYSENRMCEEKELGEIQSEINELSYAIAVLRESISFLGEKLMPIRAITPKGSIAVNGLPKNLPLTEIGNKISVLKDSIKEIDEAVYIIKSEVRI